MTTKRQRNAMIMIVHFLYFRYFDDNLSWWNLFYCYYGVFDSIQSKCLFWVLKIIFQKFASNIPFGMVGRRNSVGLIRFAFLFFSMSAKWWILEMAKIRFLLYALFPFIFQYLLSNRRYYLHVENLCWEYMIEFCV